MKNGFVALTRTHHRLLWMKVNVSNSFHIFLLTRVPTESGRQQVQQLCVQAAEAGMNQGQALPPSARPPQVHASPSLHVTGLICKRVSTSQVVTKTKSDDPGKGTPRVVLEPAAAASPGAPGRGRPSGPARPAESEWVLSPPGRAPEWSFLSSGPSHCTVRSQRKVNRSIAIRPEISGHRSA